MEELSTAPADLLTTRLLLLRDLAHSLEISQIALTRNDAEMIARGAARQAELCRQWSLLEEHRQRQSQPWPVRTGRETGSSPQFSQEFAALTSRIRHLTRVHCSLLRHLQRSLAIIEHVAGSCGPTYAPDPKMLSFNPRLPAGGSPCPD